MYPEHHYLSRSRLAEELARLPENADRRKAYLALAQHWKRLAALSATKMFARA